MTRNFVDAPDLLERMGARRIRRLSGPRSVADDIAALGAHHRGNVRPQELAARATFRNFNFDDSAGEQILAFRHCGSDDEFDALLGRAYAQWSLLTSDPTTTLVGPTRGIGGPQSEVQAAGRKRYCVQKNDRMAAFSPAQILVGLYGNLFHSTLSTLP